MLKAISVPATQETVTPGKPGLLRTAVPAVTVRATPSTVSEQLVVGVGVDGLSEQAETAIATATVAAANVAATALCVRDRKNVTDSVRLPVISHPSLACAQGAVSISLGEDRNIDRAEGRR